MQHLHNLTCWGFLLQPGEMGWDSSRNLPMDADPTWVCEGAPLQPAHTHRVPPMPLASLRYSVWCLVATKTTVWSWGFTTFRSRWSSTAGLSSPRTWKKASCRGRAELSPSGVPRFWGHPTAPCQLPTLSTKPGSSSP